MVAPRAVARLAAYAFFHPLGLVDFCLLVEVDCQTRRVAPGALTIPNLGRTAPKVFISRMVGFRAVVFFPLAFGHIPRDRKDVDRPIGKFGQILLEAFPS